MIETFQPRVVFADLSDMSIDCRVEFRHVGRREVGHTVVLHVFPQRLDRIQHRGVGGQSFEPQTLKTPEHLADRITLMHLSAVPDDDDPATEVSQERTQERSRPHTVDILTGITAEVQRKPSSPRRQAQGCAHADLVAMAGSLFEDGRTAARGKRPADQRGQQSPAFVDQDEVSVEPRRFF